MFEEIGHYSEARERMKEFLVGNLQVMITFKSIGCYCHSVSSHIHCALQQQVDSSKMKKAEGLPATGREGFSCAASASPLASAFTTFPTPTASAPTTNMEQSTTYAESSSTVDTTIVYNDVMVVSAAISIHRHAQLLCALTQRDSFILCSEFHLISFCRKRQ